MRPSLQSSEWILVSSFVLLLASLVAVSYFHQHRRASRVIYANLPVKSVAVTIQGDVRKPGIYNVPEGTQIAEIVRKSRPERFADLTSPNLSQCVNSDITIFVSKLQNVSVRVEGAVLAPEELQLPVGARLCDLKSKVQCTSDADTAFLKRRRLLKNHDVIIIPKRKEPALD